ncbi:amidase signature domain-containing protein [Immersiella caudata]|uniref:Amidase signature domain-containing protein n=1 Tax=Immersiella caudata TaxID=314043 RepID=A0AA39WQB4_9PEZI|nr:amidase signature domain-containing protein [Immersiella caudata]
MTPKFDVLSTSALELRDRLQNGTLISVDVVSEYLAQIRKHTKLNLVISLREHDRLLADANQRDEERQAGKVRSPFHGLSFLAKDASAAPRLSPQITIGSFALKESKPPANAVAIDALLEAGMTLVGKSNVTEFCGCKCRECRMVRRRRLGLITLGQRRFQERRPSSRFNAPGGSSTGSAHAAAAGFVPLPIGTETCGSLITPVGRAGVYTLKLTPGTASTEGVGKITAEWDTIGVSAKSVEEIAILNDLLLMTKEPEAVGWTIEADAKEADPNFPGEIKSHLEWTMKSIKEAGGRIVNTEVKICANQYIASLESPDVKSLGGIVEFNKANAHIELPPENPGQDGLVAAAENTDRGRPSVPAQSLLHQDLEWAVKDGTEYEPEE